MRGLHLLQHWSTTQPTVGLSSGEAELGGICRGASKALGLRSIASDLGLDFEVAVHTDATAAIGICRRRGLGKIRHLAVADLWVQDKLRTQEFTLHKIAAPENPADALTKHVDRATLDKHLAKMGWSIETGRPETAPTLTHMIFSERCLPHRQSEALRTKNHG